MYVKELTGPPGARLQHHRLRSDIAKRLGGGYSGVARESNLND